MLSYKGHLITIEANNYIQRNKFSTECFGHSIHEFGSFPTVSCLCRLIGLGCTINYVDPLYYGFTRRELKLATNSFCHSGVKEHGIVVIFLMNLQRYVVTQDDICIIHDRSKGLVVTIRCSGVSWRSIYCIRHIAVKFHKEFKNADWCKQVMNMGNY